MLNSFFVIRLFRAISKFGIVYKALTPRQGSYHERVDHLLSTLATWNSMSLSKHSP